MSTRFDAAASARDQHPSNDEPAVANRRDPWVPPGLPGRDDEDCCPSEGAGPARARPAASGGSSVHLGGGGSVAS
ncbi:hypothetical protein WMF01_19495 [Sorangium sp. So ce1667]